MSRRRTVEATQTTSDTTRFRGVAIAAIAAGMATLIACIATTGRDGLRGAPGPLSRPHARAALTCDSCHAAGDASASCSGCHGAHASTRPAHRRLAGAGTLACGGCHRVHNDDVGVALIGPGDAVRYGPGSERAVDVPEPFRPLTATTVPIVPAGACGRCHDLTAPRDPIAVCLLGEHAGLGDAQPTVCFDEHRAGDDVDSSRAAAHEAARAVAARHPVAPTARGKRAGPWTWLGIGGMVGLLVWTAGRPRRRPIAPSSSTAPIVAPPTVRRLPTINPSTCIGCHACADACPMDVIEIRHYVARVARPDDCCGLTLCEQRCPNGSLAMGDGETIDGAVVLGDDLQSARAPGVYLAGDVTGLPLIRNAINQGAVAMRAIAADLATAGPGAADVLDVVVVGAGPAGISAALEAKSAGLRCAILEQASVAGSIRSFPRGKLVFDQPLDLPLVGALWLEESTKEELLGHWLRIVRRERLDIREGVRVTGIDRGDDGAFTVAATCADAVTTVRARRILVAIGTRGTPRPLPVEIPPTMVDRVHYSLADARSFAGQRVLVVGLGDVAMETAIALSRQPGTRVTVSYRGDGFRRGKARNIEELERRVDAGAIDLRFRTEVTRIDADRVVLSSPAGRVSVGCDAVFAMLGALAPTDFLSRVGVIAGPTSDSEETS